MIRLQKLALSVFVPAALFAAAVAWTPTPSARVKVDNVAAQLGVRISMATDNEFDVGVQFGGSLDEPKKLASYGLPGFHYMARVVALRMSPDVVYVEADELEPQHKASVKLRITSDGVLIAP